ncbi:MAG: hypothetical protein J6B11_00550 [Spirochaetales bacterium]|nr:hypothetical protein [Spirochaetales bacterium]
MFYNPCTDSYGNFKKRYSTYEHAMEVKRHQESCGAHTLRIYRCPNCGYYHLTHT